MNTNRYLIMACKVFSWSILFALTVGCLNVKRPKIVVYTALDREFSQPIFDAFTKETGIGVLPKYDSESTKTVQLTTAILMESKTRTRCDLFWNNEILNTLRLDHEGLLDPYRPANADSFPTAYRSAKNHWHGFAARARVILVNTEIVDPAEMPTSIYDLYDSKWKGQVGIAKPLFGTTATHAVCLFESLGDAKAREFFERLKDNDVQILSGNKQVAEDVSSGRIKFGLTDTDDAMIEIEQGFNVKIVYPDSVEGELGTLFVPNVLALLRDGPNHVLACKLVDYLLSAEVETKLANGPSAQIPLHQDVQMNLRVETPRTVQAMQVDFEAAAKRWDEVGKYLKENFSIAD